MATLERGRYHAALFVEDGVNATSPKLEYFVVRFTDGWKIICGSKRWGRFAYQVDAVEAALRLVRQAKAKGQAAEVMVQNLWGELSPLPA